MTFKEGDLIRGLPENGYGITNEDMTKAEVLSLGHDTMRIRILEHECLSCVGYTYSVDNTDSKFAKVGEKAQGDRKGYDIRITRKPGSSDVTATADFGDHGCSVTVKPTEGEFDFTAAAKNALEQLMKKLAAEEEKAKAPSNALGVKVGDLVRVEARSDGLEVGDLAEVIGLSHSTNVYVTSPRATSFNGKGCKVPGPGVLKQPFTLLNPGEYSVLERQPVFAKREKSE